MVINNNVVEGSAGSRSAGVINVASAPALSGRAELREGGRLFLGGNTYTVDGERDLSTLPIPR